MNINNVTLNLCDNGKHCAVTNERGQITSSLYNNWYTVIYHEARKLLKELAPQQILLNQDPNKIAEIMGRLAMEGVFLGNVTDSYLKDILNNDPEFRTWGGDIELSALAAIFDVGIQVHKVDRDVTLLIGDQNGPIVHLHYDGTHYSVADEHGQILNDIDVPNAYIQHIFVHVLLILMHSLLQMILEH